jgi:AcrR family transcriptional regulator
MSAMSKPTGREPRRDAGRPRGEPILDAVLSRALEELAEHGLANLRVDRIARAAEVNKTSVYRRWPTREALVAAALERVLGDLSLELADTGSLRGDLVRLAETVAAFLSQPAGRGLARAAFAESESPELAALAKGLLERQAIGPAADLVRRARARGEWREDVAPDLLLSMLVGAILHRSMLEHRAASKAWLSAIVDVLLMGVTPRDTAGRRAGAERKG